MRIKTTYIPIFPLIVGLTAFFIVVGPRALFPSNIAWLSSGDPAQHFLGWVFFRNSPWQFPIGLNPDYGLELSNAIIYSDSNPLLAVIFKAFSAFLPVPFQYFGLWILACFCLQAWFAWKIIGLISESNAIRLIGAGFYVFAPPLLLRLNAHASLFGHFLIVAGLYICFQEKIGKRWLAWSALLVIATLSHAYLLAMVSLLWLADLAGRRLRKYQSTKNQIDELIFLSAVVVFFCWQAGYFSVVSGVSADGYGLYRMNILGPFDSNGWSYVVHDTPDRFGRNAGFNYFGLGMLLLASFAIPAFLSCSSSIFKLIKKFSSVGIALFLLTIFSWSNNIGIGSLEFSFELPSTVMQMANIFRASGRMFWPVFYAILFLLIYLVVRGYSNRTAIFIMALSLFVQIFDTSAGWLHIRKKLMQEPSSVWQTSLTDPFWASAAKVYDNIRYIPIGNNSHHWKKIADFAGRNNLGTDAVYLARVSSDAISNAQRKTTDAMWSGALDTDSIYILDDINFTRLAIMLDQNVDLLAKIDDLNVIAPKWKLCRTCPSVRQEISAFDLFEPLELGKTILFNKTENGVGYLGYGWSLQESWGTWSDGDSARIYLPVDIKRARSIVIEANFLINDNLKMQRINASINGVNVAKLTFSKSSEIFEIKIPQTVVTISGRNLLMLQLDFADAAHPKQISDNNDDRKLAMGLIGLTVR